MTALPKPTFKTCPMCKKIWTSRNVFLNDPELSFNGYQANFGFIEQGLFYFTHKSSNCGTTLSLWVKDFFSLYTGKKYTENKQFSRECPHFCLDKTRLEMCKIHCEYAYIREIIQLVKERKKGKSYNTGIEENGWISKATKQFFSS